MLLYQITHHPHMRRGVRIKRLIARTKHVVWFIFPSVRAQPMPVARLAVTARLRLFAATPFCRWCQSSIEIRLISARTQHSNRAIKNFPTALLSPKYRQIAPVIKFKMGNKLYGADAQLFEIVIKSAGCRASLYSTTSLCLSSSASMT